MTENSKTYSADDLITELNASHAAVLLGGKFVILSEGSNPNTGHPEIRLSTVADMKRVYSPQKIKRVDPKTGGIKLTNPIDLWMDHPDRRFYRGIVFIPGPAPDDYYNLFQGFFIEPEQGNCSLYLDHVLNNICGGDKDHYEWLLDWMADAVQNPAQRKGAAVVLRGDQGVGKGIFATVFGELFRPHFVHVTGQHRLTGKFNNHLNAMLVVFVDEGFWAGDRRDAGTLKAMITENDMLVEPKFQDCFTVQNHMRVIMASNNDWVVPAELSERRFFVLDVGKRNYKDTAFFGSVMGQMENGGYAALMYDLSNRKIQSDLRTIPRTQALFDQMLHSMDPLERWWHGCLLSERILEGGNGWPARMPKDAIYNSYYENCTRYRKQFILETGSFFKVFRKICPGQVTVRPRQKSSNSRGPRVVVLPDLDVCRRSFESKMGISLDWDTEGDKF